MAVLIKFQRNSQSSSLRQEERSINVEGFLHELGQNTIFNKRTMGNT